MFNKKSLLCFMIILLFSLSACAPLFNSNDSVIVGENEVEVVEETDYYKITYYDGLYQYCLFDSNHNTVKEDGPMNKPPHISVNDENVVMVTGQAGTGIGTQWGYFYDVDTNTFSQVFHSIFDQFAKNVAYADSGKVVVRDIFDSEVFYREFCEFDRSLSDVADPIVWVSFTDNGQRIKVSYLTGDDYIEMSQVFDLY